MPCARLVILDVTREHMAVNIRKYVVRAHHVDHMTRLGAPTPHAARILDAAVRTGLNSLVGGATQAAKQACLPSLASASR